MSQVDQEAGKVAASARDGAARQEIKVKVQKRLMETLDLVQAQKLPFQELRDECLRRVDYLLTELRTPLTTAEKQQLLREVMDEIFGLGPIEELLRDPAVSDVLVNGPHQVYIERQGRLESTNARFRDDAHLLQVIQRIASRVGRRIDESSPMLDARLPDGSRVNAIIPPLALQGPVMSVRRFARIPIEADTLVGLGSWTPEMSQFMQAAVTCKMNILISGGTGTGKTTLLNVLSKWIPPGERVITIEDAAELQLQREHVVALETRPPNIEGKGQVTQRDLVRNSLRMRPDRIIIGEVRGPEAIDMLQAMNTGHEGSMTTVHANSVRDALRRLENMISMAGMNYPVHVIRDQLAATLDLIIQVGRMTGGRRRIVAISELTGIEKDVVLMQDLFRFHQHGIDADGNAVGEFEICGVRPQLLERIEREGITLPAGMFQRRTPAAAGRRM
ncbi:MAG TPA: CpaF family protein [Planctomycetota bacterium]|nr:CpaF family protein [Planctomycetota bacterium]